MENKEQEQPKNSFDMKYAATVINAAKLFNQPAQPILQEQEQFEEIECENCDGCGWWEGGETLKTHCICCNGTGKIKVKVKAEPILQDDVIKEPEILKLAENYCEKEEYGYRMQPHIIYAFMAGFETANAFHKKEANE